MKRLTPVLIYIFLLLLPGWTQESDSIVDTFNSNFEMAGLEVKLMVLQDAANMNLDGMGPLFHSALDFVIDNQEKLATEGTYRKISKFSVAQIERLSYAPSKHSLWQLFTKDLDTESRTTIMKAFGVVAKDDVQIIRDMNLWLQSQNSIFMTGKKPDMQVVNECIKSLGKLGDSTSFSIIFTSLILDYNEEINKSAETALKSINGDVKQLYTEVIRSGSFVEKKLALSQVLEHPTFSDAEKCEIADFALNVALNTVVDTMLEQSMARETRYMAIDFLGAKNWSSSTQLVIKHLDVTISELDRGIAGKNFHLLAIEAMGNMKNHEAAKRLALYLQNLNAYTENGRAYDDQIVLAVIAGLKRLGDKVANKPLFYTKYLNYSDTVKKAASDAINSLQ